MKEEGATKAQGGKKVEKSVILHLLLTTYHSLCHPPSLLWLWPSSRKAETIFELLKVADELFFQHHLSAHGAFMLP